MNTQVFFDESLIDITVFENNKKKPSRNLTCVCAVTSETWEHSREVCSALHWYRENDNILPDSFDNFSTGPRIRIRILVKIPRPLFGTGSRRSFHSL